MSCPSQSNILNLTLAHFGGVGQIQAGATTTSFPTKLPCHQTLIGLLVLLPVRVRGHGHRVGERQTYFLLKLLASFSFGRNTQKGDVHGMGFMGLRESRTLTSFMQIIRK